MASQKRSQLCRVCKEINFAAILTPREWDTVISKTKALYRPELSGNGGDPSMDIDDFPKSKRAASAADYLPQIRTAYYDELSESEASMDMEEVPEIRHSETFLEESDTTSKVINEPLDSLNTFSLTDVDSEREQRSEDFGDDSDSNDVSKDHSIDEDDEDDSSGHFREDVVDDAYEYSSEDDEGDASEYDSADAEDDISGHSHEDDNHSSASTWSGDSHFTEIERIDLVKQAQGKWDYRHGHLYYLGSIWDLRSRRHDCELCRMLWHRIRSNPDVKSLYLTKSRCVLRLIDLHRQRSNSCDSEIHLFNLLFIYAYKVTKDPRDSNWIVKYPYIFQGMHPETIDRDSTNMASFDDSMYGQARLRDDTCNYDLFREWLRVCETRHEHSTAASIGNLSFRLIDVEQGCLIDWSGPVSEIPRYVALSYVWGRTQQLVVLTEKLLNDFKRPGFLNCRLDQTIRDSIDLCARIGERYIWIDALCIIQDASKDKARQISQMHQIYGQAILTIVAASGNDANSGLPGVSVPRKPCNKIRLELDGVSVTTRTNRTLFHTERDIGFAENYLTSSTYCHRAWTFQESMLSNRLLIFAKTEIHWECSRCTWSEETHFESDSIDFVGWRSLKNSTPIDVWADTFDRRAYDYSFEEPKEHPQIESYAHLIREYTNRDLTHDEDILDACTGVLSSVQEREQSEFLFGLRSNHFGNDLLFNVLQFTVRRFPFQAPMRNAIPTWSWASWSGKIEIPNEPRYNSYDPVENLVPCDGVRCHMLEMDQSECLHLRTINDTGGWRFTSDYVRKGEGIWDPSMFLRSSKANSSAQEMNSEIPNYPQALTLADVESHLAFPFIVPKFHILFYTFSTTVVLRTDYHQLDDMTEGLVDNFRSGDEETKLGIVAGVLEDRRKIRRSLYVCRENPAISSLVQAERENPLQDEPEISDTTSAGKSTDRGEESMVELPPNLQQEIELGPLIPNPELVNYPDHIAAIPDGVYRFLWMNNNQIPTFQHLLCRPVFSSESKDGKWDDEILERVSGAMGPINILEKAQQEKFGATWKLHILG